jgi:hypothetical protein
VCRVDQTASCLNVLPERVMEFRARRRGRDRREGRTYDLIGKPYTCAPFGVRTFDPVRVGFQTDVPGFARFNVNNPDGTPITGNSNAGHEFGANLDDQERARLLEYLKTL